MHVVIAFALAGVLAGVGVAWLAVVRARRRRLPPAFEITPAVAYCRVRDVADVAAAWRARGFVVVARRRRVDVRTLDGARAELELPAARRLGDAPFVIRSHHARLVHDLAAIASRELGPLACSIDGYVHGFDAAPEPDPASPAHALAAGASAATRALRPAAERAASAVTRGPPRTPA